MTNYQVNLENITPIEQLQFAGLDEKYKKVHLIGMILIYLLLMALALLLLLTGYLWICILAEGIIIIAAIINLTMIPKAFRFKGYAFRQHDLSYRSGIIFPKLTTIPYSRIQQISVNQNPISRLFNLYSLDVVNGAQELSTLNIPGLTESKAMDMKSFLTQKLTLDHDD